MPTMNTFARLNEAVATLAESRDDYSKDPLVAEVVDAAQAVLAEIEAAR